MKAKQLARGALGLPGDPARRRRPAAAGGRRGTRARAAARTRAACRRRPVAPSSRASSTALPFSSGSARRTRTRCARPEAPASRSSRSPRIAPSRMCLPRTWSACRRARASRSTPSRAAVARRLGENGTALAARLPVLRPAVCSELIRSFSKKNGILSAAIFVPGVDMPILTLNQIRLVLRLALAHGQDVDRDRAIELAGVVGAGFGFRAIARAAARLRALRRLGGQGRGRLHRHAGDRHRGAEVLRQSGRNVRSRSLRSVHPGWR